VAGEFIITLKREKTIEIIPRGLPLLIQTFPKKEIKPNKYAGAYDNISQLFIMELLLHE